MACVVVALGVLVVAGCNVSTSDRRVPELTTTYTDPDGAFEIQFPFEPEVSEKADSGVPSEARLTTVEAASDDFTFTLGYSDAPVGVQLTKSQVLADSVAQENADRDGADLVDVATDELFGRPALAFTVKAKDGDSRYFDINVVLGGRRYELTVIQFGDDRTLFDNFVASFHLLEPPLDDDADFFADAEKFCARFSDSRPARPDNETVEEHVAAIQAVVDHQRDLVETLSASPASSKDQGDAAAFIDAVRRSQPAGEAYVEAIKNGDPAGDAAARRASLDLDLAYDLAKKHHATSCP